MEKEAGSFIATQITDRQATLAAIHKVIMAQDKTVSPVIEPMMGKEMIIYKGKGMMKYGLASVKNYMSLHVLPMYMNTNLFAKYQALLPAAAFQKGCINFTGAEQVPLPILNQLFKECAAIDLVKIREEQLAKKKADKKKKAS